MQLTMVIPLSPGKCGEALQNCIASLKWQTFRSFTPLLVVLEGNEDWPHRIGSRQKFKKWCEDENVKAVFRESPHLVWAPSLSRNIGFRLAPAPYMASLDADAVLGPRFLEFAMKQFETGKGVRSATFMCEEYPFWGGFKTRDQVVKALDRSGMTVGTGPGCFIGAPKKTVWRVRGWDEEFIGYGPTDWDYVKRLRQTGLAVVDLARKYGQQGAILHQNHERDEDTRLRVYIERNRALYAETCAKKKGPARNPHGWGEKR